jgi:hypothetical protein
MGKELGLCAIHEAEIEFMTKEMKPLLLPKFAWVAETANEPVGFALGLPDINVVLRDLNGRLTRFGFPIGLIKLLFYRKRIRKGRLVALGVIEKYRRAALPRSRAPRDRRNNGQTRDHRRIEHDA